MESTIEVHLDNIFFQSYARDPETGSPIYVFDSTYLPSVDELERRDVYDLLIDALMDKLVAKLPTTPFSLVVFSSGFTQNNVSWIYGVKMYSKIPKSTRAKLQKMFVVHESFFVRTVYQVLTNALSINLFKNRNKADSVINHVANLSELSEYVDITRLRISLNVYLYDYQFDENIITPETSTGERSSLANRQYRQLVFDKIFKRLQIEAPKKELVFQRPGNYQKVNILMGVIARNNYVDLSQWDIYALATVFLHFIKGKSKPILPIDLIPLPINDSFEYTYNTFVSMMMYNGYYDLTTYIFHLFLKLLENSDMTLHDYKSLSKCLTSTLCKEKVSLKASDRLAIGNRYTTNILFHFKDLQAEIERRGSLATPSSCRTPRFAKEAPLIPPPRKNSPSKAGTASSSPTRSKDTSKTPPALPERRHQETSVNASFANAGARGQISSSRQLQVSGSDFSLDSRHSISPTRSPSRGKDSDSRSSRSPARSSKIQKDLKDTSVSPQPPVTGLYSTTGAQTTSSLSFTTTPHLRHASDSSINVSSGGDSSTKPQCQLVPEEAVTFKPKPTDNVLKLEQSVSNLLLDNNQKIQSLDKELRKKKQATSSDTSRFSSTSYSDLKAENKVSRLAALYEERLVGYRVMEDMRRNQ